MENIFAKAAELQKANKSFVLATLVSAADSTPRNTGARMIIFPDGKIIGTIGGGTLEKRVMLDAQKMFSENKNKSVRLVYDLTSRKRTKKGVALGMLCGGQAEVFLEYFAGGLDLVICGAGHIGENLARLSRLLEWNYAVLDDRPEFANSLRFPDASTVVAEDFSTGFKKINITSRTAIVIVTYGHRYDTRCLLMAIETPAYYIGMIGSKNKVQKIFTELKNRKIKIPDNVYSPVGLNIGADSPVEIAISIVSEILSVRNKTRVGHMRLNG